MRKERARAPLAERFGLHRRELRAWAMYDWANSAFMTTIIAVVFPIYYAEVAADKLAPNAAAFRFSIATTIALTVVALISPLLGALADYAGIKKRLLFVFQSIGVTACALMVLIGRGDWLLALILFVLGNIGVSGAFTFYDSLLPHVARSDELDRVSTAGYALGYLGGGLLLALNLVIIEKPSWFGLADTATASRLSFLSVAIWWALFSIPLFRRVPEPPRQLDEREGARRNALIAAFARLGGTFRELARFKQALLMLLAFLLYNDGINTIIRMASLYGAQIGIAQHHLILALLMVQFIGIPFAFLFGRMAAWVGAKRAVFISLAVYMVVSVLGYYMTTALHFYLLAILVGMVQGGSQALSRSLFATMIPRYKSSEFFGFFAVFEKFAGILGPLLFAAAVGQTGSSRAAILSIIFFFVVGAALLAFVNVPEGERLAREAERHAREAAESTRQ
ncbi:MAG: MFS transporter [Acidobacteriota bacterium]